MSSNTLVCPNCGAPLRLYAHRLPDGRLVCSKCGYVIEESPIDLGPEWRSFNEEDRARRSRVGAPLTARIHDQGLTTYIYAKRTELRARKLVALQANLRSHGQKKLISILQEANRAASKLRLPSRVSETMARILRQLYNTGILRKNNISEYIAAAAVIAARIEKHPLTMRDTAEVLGVNEQDVWRAYRRIVTKLRVRPAAPPRPQMFVSRIASKLNVSGEVETLAMRFATLLVSTGLAQGKPPEALAAASVYLASILLDQKRNQLAVARTINVTDATIRNRYRDIVDNFYIEVRL
ncbi:transcription initiation factor IIB family protein [Pyrofollis japonicus]|jgi:transcription initiation factor TFIIB|uniref:transcription initiation factor IIB n=1 Tax=Pyrofollis japonicus TaxID=3060460 RepID=UPI00295A76B9|nr:transcription initiation factor IIB family protein [Pyrofollis japonicus]BEP18604.1 transcription initiation factor IIB family protein [Pyrofollis japonicus]